MISRRRVVGFGWFERVSKVYKWKPWKRALNVSVEVLTYIGSKSLKCRNITYYNQKTRIQLLQLSFTNCSYSWKNTPRIIHHFQRYLERSWGVLLLTTWIKGTVLRSGRGVREGKQISGPEGITHEHFTFVFCNLSFELVRSDCRTSSGKRSNLTGHAISECSWVSLYVLKMLSMRPHATLSIVES